MKMFYEYADAQSYDKQLKTTTKCSVFSPDMTRPVTDSSENLNDELNKSSAVTGNCSMSSPSNLYKLPFNDGIKRTDLKLCAIYSYTLRLKQRKKN